MFWFILTIRIIITQIAIMLIIWYITRKMAHFLTLINAGTKRQNGLSQRINRFGVVASCDEKNTRNVIRHPTSPKTINSCVSNHLDISLLLTSTRVTNMVSTSSSEKQASGVRNHGVGPSVASLLL